MAGNAYGAGCSFDLNSGMFVFYSYRDPHLLQTVDAFNGGPALPCGACVGALPMQEGALRHPTLHANGSVCKACARGRPSCCAR